MESQKTCINFSDIKFQEEMLSMLFKSNVKILLMEGRKNSIVSEIDFEFSLVAKRFFHKKIGVSSNNKKSRKAISFIVYDTLYPHKEIVLQKSKINKILKTNYIVHSYQDNPCITYFLSPHTKINYDL